MMSQSNMLEELYVMRETETKTERESNDRSWALDSIPCLNFLLNIEKGSFKMAKIITRDITDVTTKQTNILCCVILVFRCTQSKNRLLYTCNNNNAIIDEHMTII